MVQTLTDAEALVFMEKNFPQVRKGWIRGGLVWIGVD